MIGTIETYPQAHSPDFPLDTLKAFVGSPSSMRIRNVPKKVGSWQITKVYVEVVYPDNTSQTADCTLVGGVWVCTIAGSSTAGTLTQGYTVYADGTDENGNAVTGYILGKGDVVIMQASSTPEPEPATIFVRLKDDGTDAEEGAIFPTEDGYAVQQNGEMHLLGRPFDQITAYVETQVSSKAEISEVEAVVEDVEDLSNSLSNYYTKSETSSAAEINSSFEAVQAAITEVDNSLSDYYLKNETSSSVEIQNALDTKQPVGDYALTSQIPTAVSQLENDAGYLTEHQSLSDYYTKSETSSNVELNTKFATKADLSALDDKRSVLDFNVYEDPLANVSAVVFNFTVAYASSPEQPFLSATMVHTGGEAIQWTWHVSDNECTIDYETDHYQLIYHNFQDGGGNPHSGSMTAPLEYPTWSCAVGDENFYFTVTSQKTIIATQEWVQAEISAKADLTALANYVTSAQVEPYYNFNEPNVPTGLAYKARMLEAVGSDDGKLDTDANMGIMVNRGDDFIPVIKAQANYNTYFPWNLSQFFEQTYSPALELVFYYGKIAKMMGSRPRIMYTGYMFVTYSEGSGGFAMPCGEDGMPTGTLYEIDTKSTAYIVYSNDNQIHTIELGGIYGTNEIVSIDGQENQITCTRASAFKNYSYTYTFATQDYVNVGLSSKADLSALSTKADLSALDDYYTKNETSSAIEISNALETKRDWNDLKVKGIPPNVTTSRFNISDGTTTTNAYWYSEGRWESGSTFQVLSTLTADVYELNVYDSNVWTSVGTFSLDNNYEATITNDGTTYSIIGYVGDIVVNNELSSYATREWVMEQLAALSVMLQGGN